MACDAKTARDLADHGLGSHPATRTWPTAGERIAEIGEILAAGLMRLRARKSSQKSADCGEISLDLNAQQSGPEPNSPREIKP